MLVLGDSWLMLESHLRCGSAKLGSVSNCVVLEESLGLRMENKGEAVSFAFKGVSRRVLRNPRNPSIIVTSVKASVHHTRETPRSETSRSLKL